MQIVDADWNWSPEDLRNEHISLKPLQESDFEALFAVASDPLIWDQHPDRERYKREVFRKFFDGAMESRSAFLILNDRREVIGTTRYYDYEPEISTIKIGYTFFSRAYWGGPINRASKDLMIDYAFQFVENVVFQVGSENYRSQKAVLKLGAEPVDPIDLEIAGNSTPHVQFVIRKEKWQASNS